MNTIVTVRDRHALQSAWHARPSLVLSKNKCRKEPIPSLAIFRDCPDVVVRRNPAGSVSEAPGIMLIPWTSRGGNCRRQEGPRLKFLSSLCQHTVVLDKAKWNFWIKYPAVCYLYHCHMYSVTATLLSCTASSHCNVFWDMLVEVKPLEILNTGVEKLFLNLWLDIVKEFSIS